MTWVLSGVAVADGARARVPTRGFMGEPGVTVEEISPDAFRESVVPLCVDHDWREVGRARLARTPLGLEFECRLADTAANRALAGRVRRRQLKGVSVAMRDVRRVSTGGLTPVSRVVGGRLTHLSLVDRPAHVTTLHVREEAPATPREPRGSGFPAAPEGVGARAVRGAQRRPERVPAGGAYGAGGCPRHPDASACTCHHVRVDRATRATPPAV